MAVTHFRTEYDAIVGELELVSSPFSSLNALEKTPMALTLHAHWLFEILARRLHTR